MAAAADDTTTTMTAGGAVSRSPLSVLADRLCAAIQRDGKAAVSIWQVRRHLHIYAHSAEAAAEAAGTLIGPARSCGVDALAIDELDTYGWLRRAGLEHHAKALEEKGYTTARSLYGIEEAVLEECDVSDKPQRKRLLSLTGGDHRTHARALRGFTSPDLPHIRAAFLATVGGEQAGSAAAARVESAATAALATEFASALCEPSGRGLVSLTQLERCLDRLKGEAPSAVVTKARAELLHHIRPVAAPPAKKEAPSAWVYGWLVEHKLGGYADKFIEQGFEAKADLQMAPRLTLQELESKLNIEKGADARKLLELITEL